MLSLTSVLTYMFITSFALLIDPRIAAAHGASGLFPAGQRPHLATTRRPMLSLAGLCALLLFTRVARRLMPASSQARQPRCGRPPLFVYLQLCPLLCAITAPT